MVHMPSASAQLLQLMVGHVNHSRYLNYICINNVNFLNVTIDCLFELILYITVDTFLNHARTGVPGMNQY